MLHSPHAAPPENDVCINKSTSRITINNAAFCGCCVGRYRILTVKCDAKLPGYRYYGSPFFVMYLSLRFDHCLISNREFSRTSYFFWKRTIPISEISEIPFPPTWIISPEARTLVVWRKDGEKITMTDMAYNRLVLADVVRTLLHSNPNIKLDDSAQVLLQSSKSSSSK